MPEGQDKIYYITAENFAAAQNSPHLEIFNKKKIEVLLMVDRVDEWVAGHLTEFDGKHMQSVTKGDLDLGDLDDKQDEKAKEEEQSNFESMLKQIKEALGEDVKEVRLTLSFNRFTCLYRGRHVRHGQPHAAHYEISRTDSPSKQTYL